jgi:hypothetical protein
MIFVVQPTFAGDKAEEFLDNWVVIWIREGERTVFSLFTDTKPSEYSRGKKAVSFSIR